MGGGFEDTQDIALVGFNNVATPLFNLSKLRPFLKTNRRWDAWESSD